MTISMLPLFCKKKGGGTNHSISNSGSAPSYKTEAMCKGKQMIVSVKNHSFYSRNSCSTAFATYVRIAKVIFQLF